MIKTFSKFFKFVFEIVEVYDGAIVDSLKMNMDFMKKK